MNWMRQETGEREDAAGDQRCQPPLSAGLRLHLFSIGVGHVCASVAIPSRFFRTRFFGADLQRPSRLGRRRPRQRGEAMRRAGQWYSRRRHIRMRRGRACNKKVSGTEKEKRTQLESGASGLRRGWWRWWLPGRPGGDWFGCPAAALRPPAGSALPAPRAAFHPRLYSAARYAGSMRNRRRDPRVPLRPLRGHRSTRGFMLPPATRAPSQDGAAQSAAGSYPCKAGWPGPEPSWPTVGHSGGAPPSRAVSCPASSRYSPRPRPSRRRLWGWPTGRRR